MDQSPKRPVPVFPLPGVVLFPGAEMHLHVFELRYRTMVRDALSSERLIALATLAPGYEQDYHGSPAFHELGCVARFDDVEWLPNDHYELRVTGTVRAHFGRMVREFPYRAHVIEALPDAPYTESDPMAQMARQGLLHERSRLAPWGAEVWLAPPVFDPAGSLAAIVGGLATAIRLPDADKFELLGEDDVVQRARHLRERMLLLGPGSPPSAPPPMLGQN